MRKTPAKMQKLLIWLVPREKIRASEKTGAKKNRRGLRCIAY